MSFQIGEVVKLRSGGPLMTITSTSVGPGRLTLFCCSWFDKDNREQTGSFPAEALSKPAAKKAPENPTVVNTRRGGGSGTGWMR
jgi:uncharacterized protein YodC (DUF2158 family)